MIFLSPSFLLAIVPWLALAAWVFRGITKRQSVPFVQLWRQSDQPQPVKRSFILPPVSILLLMLALLMAIVAMAKPRMAAGNANPHVTVIVDRGGQMSLNRIGNETGYASAASRANDAVQILAPNANVAVEAVPPAEQPISLQSIATLTPTAVDDPSAVRAKIRQALERADGPVIALTDINLAPQANLFRAIPVAGINDVGIAGISARATPRPSVMVTILNQSDLRETMLTIDSDQNQIVQNITLPARGAALNYFVDLPSAPKVLKAKIDAARNPDQLAWLLRRASWPNLQLRSDVGQNLQRFVEIYSKNRPTSEVSQTVAIVRMPASVPADIAAAIIFDKNASTQPIDVTVPFTLSDSAIDVRSIDWKLVLDGGRVAKLPGGTWTPILSQGEQVLIAVDEWSPRKIWIGFDSPRFAQTPDFVLFWKNVVEWLGSGRDVYAASQPVMLDAKWKMQNQTISPTDNGLIPGLYQAEDGASLAINASPRLITPSADTFDVTAFRAALLNRAGGRNITPLFIALTLASLVFALLVAIPRQSAQRSRPSSVS